MLSFYAFSSDFDIVYFLIELFDEVNWLFLFGCEHLDVISFRFHA